MEIDNDLNIETFIVDFRYELTREMARRPKSDNPLADLTTEIGLLAKSMLDIGDHQSKDWWNVWQGAKHVAAMAAFCALNGDSSLRALPTKENTK